MLWYQECSTTLIFPRPLTETLFSLNSCVLWSQFLRYTVMCVNTAVVTDCNQSAPVNRYSLWFSLKTIGGKE